MMTLPIIGLFLALLVIILIIIEGLENQKVPTVKIIIGAINMILAIVIASIYKPVLLKDQEGTKWVVLGFLIFEVALTTIFTLAYVIKLVLKKRELSLFYESIKDSPWNTYLILSRNDKIKVISDNLLEELDLPIEEVKGHKLFDVINRSIRISNINGYEMTNREVEEKYEQLKKITKKGEIHKLEITFYNYDGESMIIHLFDQPMFSKIGYYGRFMIGEKKTDLNLLGIEKQLKTTEEEFDSLQEKFIATLEVSSEGLMYRDIDEETCWISDSLKEELEFNSNEVNVQDYLKLIQPDDLNSYLLKINQLSPSNPVMNMKYRVFIRGIYHWFEDTTKRVFLDEKAMLVSSIKPVNSKHFMASNIEELDKLGDESELMVKLDQVIDSSQYFHLAILKVKNLKHINETHGRALGNIALAEYVKKIKKSLTEEEGEMFRVSGSSFAVIVSDQRRLTLLRKGSQERDKYLNMKMTYGSVTFDLEIFAGISIINNDGYNPQEMVEAAKQALKVAENPKYKGQICYYGDL